MHQQREDEDEQIGLLLDAIQRGPFRLTERLAAALALVAASFLAVDGAVASPDVPSGSPFQIRAKLVLRVHLGLYSRFRHL